MYSKEALKNFSISSSENPKNRGPPSKKSPIRMKLKFPLNCRSSWIAEKIKTEWQNIIQKQMSGNALAWRDWILALDWVATFVFMLKFSKFPHRIINTIMKHNLFQNYDIIKLLKKHVLLDACRKSTFLFLFIWFISSGTCFIFLLPMWKTLFTFLFYFILYFIVCFFVFHEIFRQPHESWIYRLHLRSIFWKKC